MKNFIKLIFWMLCFSFTINADARAFERIAYLDQGWELYWQKLLEPTDFQNKEIIFNTKQPFPFFWSNIEINGRNLPSDGFLTLRKKIRISQSFVGKELGLRVPEMFSAYSLFVNGDRMAANGIVSADPSVYQPQWRPLTVTFTPNGNEIEFVLQIANFSYVLGGGWRKIEFGPAHKIRTRTQTLTFLDIFLFASVLTMGLYHVGLFTKRRQSLSSLFFSILCMVVALRTLVSGEILIYHFFNPSWELLLKLNFLSVVFLAPLFICFQHHLFSGCSDKRIVKGFLILSGLFASIIILFPAKVHSLFLDVYHIASLAGCLYIFWVFTKAIKRTLDGSLISLLAFLVPFVAALNDMLTVNNYINTEQMLPYGLIVYFVAQSIMLAQRFSLSLNREEILSKKLEELNGKLEDKVEERTNKLKQAMSEIKQLTGMLPICAHCKKIRDDKGYWKHVEEYVSQHSDAVFSHGICPSCIKKIYPKFRGKKLRDCEELNDVT